MRAEIPAASMIRAVRRQPLAKNAFGFAVVVGRSSVKQGGALGEGVIEQRESWHDTELAAES